MPTSQRELALAAFFDLFDGLTAYPLKRRMPNWTIGPAEIPCLVQYDGGAAPLAGDDASSGISGVMRLALRVNVTLGVRAESIDGADPDLSPMLSAARADIRAAVAIAPTLGGLVEHVKYEGDEDPVQLFDQGAPNCAVFPINFIIVMTEAELDPYSAF